MDTANPADWSKHPVPPLNPPPQSLPVPDQPPESKPSTTSKTEETKPESIPESPPIVEKRTAPRRATARPEPAAEIPPVTPTPAPPAAQPAPAAEVPRIAPILSDSQARELSQAIEAALTSAEQNLRVARPRERDTRQQKMLEQAEAFVRQARQFRGSDPVSAKSFADKADQLSRELVSTYR